MEENCLNDFNMQPTLGDKALYTKHDAKHLTGIPGSYVTNSLYAGTSKAYSADAKSFESNLRLYDNFDIYGTQIETLPEHSFKVSQKYYS